MPDGMLERQQRLLEELAELVRDRVADEADFDRSKKDRDREVLQRYEALRAALAEESEAEVNYLRTTFNKRREETVYNYETNSYNLVQEGERAESEAAKLRDQSLKQARKQCEAARRAAEEQYQGSKDEPREKLSRNRATWDIRRSELDQLWEEAEQLLRRRRVPPPGDRPVVELGAGEPLELFQAAFRDARVDLRWMAQLPLGRFVEEGWPILVFLFTALALAWPLGSSLGWLLGCIASATAALLLVWILRLLIRPRVRAQTAELLPDMLESMGRADAAVRAALQAAEQAAADESAALVAQREQTIRDADQRWEQAKREVQNQFEERVKAAKQEFQTRRRSLQETYRQDLLHLNEKYPPRIAQREREYAETAQQLVDQRLAQMEANQQAADDAWERLAERWRGGIAECAREVSAMNARCDERAPAWNSVDWSQREVDLRDLEALRFGELQFRLDMLPQGVSQRLQLAVEPTEFRLPAALTYPDCPSLIYRAEAEGRDVAVRSMQNVMLRLLTALPPGKVRFTIVDPVGLGQNFSAFMHLADFDERLVSSRIWTESPHIARRLADLTEHMESVIQKYLRNEFASIHEYNHHAGEVAEPFQILVIANFPANFSEETARRLVSIAQSGPRCGVFTLISVDRRLRLPQGFELADLESSAVVLEWEEGRFRLPEATLKELPLTLDLPPDDECFTAAVRAIGERAKDAARVEVPFASVVPAEGSWWSQDSRGELVAPLGRAGATSLQYLRLGKGTSQHVLVSGKTGSGKSTLLHALITNLSIHYSPDEVQFYLIDFKKGVEFKAYATFALPHARVIAIESEREFGMSVLERLDAELRRRGDMFRGQGVQDLRAYRDARPDQRLARLLLIIDEFQEFFVKDDKIAQDAALLLDRLVRQGRAFGIHVMLGSQTLAGAYSLARSTLGQMAVRIALQCSEADAHLILSDENTAARLLNRPGEAIYNDANGLFEGNHPFQVVWLPDQQREIYLRRIGELAEQRGVDLPAPVVFEGNAPADPARNELLHAALAAPRPPALPAAPRAWLGEAVAIKEPPCAALARRSGSNLLIVGQQEEAALGVLAGCVVSLAAELSGGAATGGRAAEDGEEKEETPQDDEPVFYVLDGQRSDSPASGFWDRLADSLPLDLRVAGPKKTAATVRELAAEVERRVQTGDEAWRPLFLIVFNLPRFRELKRSEDYKFSFDDQAPSPPDRLFAQVLRDGPAVAVHTLIWCDGYTSLNRAVDRESLQDLSLRVLFQMSAADSANLMDSPEAGRLGVHRAIFYDEEQGTFEKFRPYGLPDDSWLSWVRGQLEQRAAVTLSTLPQSPTLETDDAGTTLGTAGSPGRVDRV